VPNRYAPTQWTFTVHPGADETITLDDGETYSGDVTQDWASLIQEFGQAPDYLTCDQNNASNTVVSYFMNYNGADVAWRLTRAR
jgi:hypothetical protein